jgi:hypothetical protein
MSPSSYLVLSNFFILRRFPYATQVPCDHYCTSTVPRVTIYKVNHFNNLGPSLARAPQTSGSEAAKNLRISCYRLAWIEVEVPTSLVTVTETEAIDWIGAVPVGRPVPVRVKGIEIWNCPPNASDAVL